VLSCHLGVEMEVFSYNYALSQGQYAGLDYDKEVGVMMTSEHYSS